MNRKSALVVRSKLKKRKFRGKKDLDDDGALGLGLGFAAAIAAAGATVFGLTSMAFSLPLLLACIAGVAAILASVGGLLIVLSPLIPGVLLAFHIFGLTAAFLWTLFDRLLCWLMVLNFVGGIFSHFLRPEGGFREGKKSKKLWGAWGDYSGQMNGQEEKITSWVWPTVMSLFPGINGSAWVLATAQNSSSLSLSSRVSMLKNGFVYGGPAILSLLTATLVTPSGHAPLLPLQLEAGSSWWVSLFLGAVHLQLLKYSLERKSTGAGVEKERQRGKNKLSDDEVMALEAERELEEFDVRLGHVVSSNIEGQQWNWASVDEWSVGNVGQWLRSKGFSRYVSAFQEHDIDGEVLLELTMEELKEDIGVNSLGDRKRILDLISSLELKTMKKKK